MSKFQKRHYLATAGVIAGLEDPQLRDNMASRFADLFQEDSGKFKRSMFITACHSLF